jgi:hypothetical protein
MTSSSRPPCRVWRGGGEGFARCAGTLSNVSSDGCVRCSYQTWLPTRRISPAMRRSGQSWIVCAGFLSRASIAIAGCSRPSAVVLPTLAQETLGRQESCLRC